LVSVNDLNDKSNERRGLRLGVLSKIEIEVIKACILEFLDSSPGLLTQKIVADHVFKMNGI
jgi:hypothetical protein